MALGRMGEFEAAIEAMNTYIQLHPASALAYTKRGVPHLWNQYHLVGEAELALEVVDDALKLDPGNRDTVLLKQRAQDLEKDDWSEPYPIE